MSAETTQRLEQVVDSDVDATAALQKHIVDEAAAGTAQVWFPPGTYRVSSALRFPSRAVATSEIDDPEPDDPDEAEATG